MVSQQSIHRSLWSKYINSSRPIISHTTAQRDLLPYIQPLETCRKQLIQSGGQDSSEAWPCHWQVWDFGQVTYSPWVLLLRLHGEAINIHILRGLRLDRWCSGWSPLPLTCHAVGTQLGLSLSSALPTRPQLKAKKLLNPYCHMVYRSCTELAYVGYLTGSNSNSVQKNNVYVLQSKHQPLCFLEEQHSFDVNGKEGILFVTIPGCSSPQMLLTASCSFSSSKYAAHPMGLCSGLANGCFDRMPCLHAARQGCPLSVFFPSTQWCN